jgi:hypothetical protein
MLTIGARHASANTFVYATGLSTATLYTARHRNVLAAKHSSAKKLLCAADQSRWWSP